MKSKFHFVLGISVLFFSVLQITNAQEVRVDLFAEPDSLRVGDVLNLNFEIVVSRFGFL